MRYCVVDSPVSTGFSSNFTLWIDAFMMEENRMEAFLPLFWKGPLNLR